jgi:hypothetical protein
MGELVVLDEAPDRGRHCRVLVVGKINDRHGCGSGAATWHRSEQNALVARFAREIALHPMCAPSTPGHAR